jgi:hypothetical protein
MIPNANVRSFQPMLEKLEDRAQPSFLLAGAVQQLTPTLNNIVSDMKSASTDLQAQFTLIKNNTAPTNTYAGAEVVADKAVADWQRILNDSAAIKAVVNTDIAFIHAAAVAEFSEGDNTDALLVFFGPVIGFDPTKALRDTVTQANNILNDPTLQNIVATNLNSLNFYVDSTTPIAQETFAVSF